VALIAQATEHPTRRDDLLQTGGAGRHGMLGHALLEALGQGGMGGVGHEVILFFFATSPFPYNGPEISDPSKFRLSTFFHSRRQNLLVAIGRNSTQGCIK
ncbi:hypothetical protein, partial [Limimaricola cinnabarinus]|uniref:hypothetical protein n=1 Tax=Limimaricola cinnabarinus TaxID=1125964 RepID=UPI0013A6398C